MFHYAPHESLDIYPTAVAHNWNMSSFTCTCTTRGEIFAYLCMNVLLQRTSFFPYFRARVSDAANHLEPSHHFIQKNGRGENQQKHE